MKNILYLFVMFCATTVFAQKMDQPARWGKIQGTLTDQDDLVAAQTNNNAIQAAILSSMTVGNEGIRKIGALGGYTLEEFFEDTYLAGPSRDKPVWTYSPYPATNLVVSYTGGDVYSPSSGYYHLLSGTKTLTDSSINYAYWQTNTPTIVQWKTGERPGEGTIVIGRFATAMGAIISVDETHAAGQTPLSMLRSQAELMPSLVITPAGMLVSATGTALSNVIMTAGFEYQDMIRKVEHYNQNLSDTNVTSHLMAYSKTNGNYIASTTNIVPVGFWNDGTNVIACDAANWYRGLFVSVYGSREMQYVYPQAAYTSQVDAIAGTDPIKPTGFDPYIISSTAYIFKGDDTTLRLESEFWIDRRSMIRAGATSSSGGSGVVTVPALSQVMAAGSSLGGILPHDAGLPVSSDELTSKEYVDSTINQINSSKVYVDQKSGSNETAQIESSILPYKTIQAAINAAAATATDTKRFSVVIGPAIYTENITMTNYVSLIGGDIEATRIHGTLTFPTTFVDTVGSEVALLTITSSNTPAVVFNAGDDDAYMGFRSCFIESTYDNGQTNKSTILIYRGLAEIYATTYLRLTIAPTNGSGSIRNAQIFEHTDNPSNLGLSQFTSFNSSCFLDSSDENDTISLMYTHDNTDAQCINTLLGTLVNSHLDTTPTHSNQIITVQHKNAQGRTLSMGTVTRQYLHQTNNVNVLLGVANGGTADNVAIIRGNHVRFPNGSTSNIWFGAAVGTLDRLRVYDSVFINNYADMPYPKIYTNDGAAGKFFINTVAENGDQLFGGPMDMSIMNSISGVTAPATGHLKMYAGTYAGLENPYYKDSSGNIVRMSRDNFYNGYNAETTTLHVGEAVFITSGLSSDNTPKVKRSIASDPTTMPSIGLVVQVGGIATGQIGRIMIMGRMEAYMDTSAFASGDKLYVSADHAGGLTNVAPTGTNIQQIIGTCHISSTNGYVNVRTFKPDTLGGLTPSAYATYATPVFSHDLFMLTNSGAAKFSVTDIPAGTTNTYTLPSVGGQLASYTDIQIVPVSCSIGEAGGILKGRVVYQSGAVGGRPQIKYADRSIITNLPVIGVTSASGNLGDIIEVVSFGPITGLDTSLFTANGLMYLGTNGLLMGPSSLATDAMIMMGTCTLSDPTSGSMLVNIRSYFQDGSYNGSMRYTVKNASTGATAVASYFAMNDIGASVRMVIRGSGNTRGPASIVSANATGPIFFANARKKPITWNIDMTDTGDEFTHLNWPMMSLVPQTGVASNSFFGVGTTNPLAMLHVAGSGLVQGNFSASNGYRLATGTYSNNEWITYADTTNLNQSLQTQIDTTTNRVKIIENKTNLWNQASTDGINATNRITVIEGKTNLWNQASTDGINATNRITVIEGRTNTWNGTTTTVNNMPTSNWNTAYTYINSNSNDINYTLSRTSVWDAASTPIRFKSALLVNVTLVQNTPTKLPMSNIVLAASGGSVYSNTLSRWSPKTSGKIMEFHGSVCLLPVANNQRLTISLYKNGTNYADMFQTAALRNNIVYGQSWSFIETVNISTNDYYEIFYTTDQSSSSTSSAGTNNWWFGAIE